MERGSYGICGELGERLVSLVGFLGEILWYLLEGFWISGFECRVFMFELLCVFIGFFEFYVDFVG